MSFRQQETARHSPSSQAREFRFPFPEKITQSPEALISPIFREILNHPEGANGFDNPYFQEAEQHPFTEEYVLGTIQHKTYLAPNDQNFAEKQAAIDAFGVDAAKLVERVNAFEKAFAQEFAGTALFEVDKPFTPALVFRLREFLITWIPKNPEDFPGWDCNPITQYSREQQVMNFAQRTLKHIDADMLYVYEYSMAWNAQVEEQPLSVEEKAQLKLDPYFMMCRALLHDLGRWFTQDSRAHEEIPAAIAVTIGLRRDLLTLEDGIPGTHPRDFDVTQPISKKTLIRIIEFFSDFNSKPHDDFVWPETVALITALQSLDKNDPNFAALTKAVAKLEYLRQAELRHPHLYTKYFLYSGRGYIPTSIEDTYNWEKLLEAQYAQVNPGKLQYLKTEKRMLETGSIFLEVLGLAPSTIRNRVMQRWQQLDSHNANILSCFPEMRTAIEVELSIQRLTEALNHTGGEFHIHAFLDAILTTFQPKE